MINLDKKKNNGKTINMREKTSPASLMIIGHLYVGLMVLEIHRYLNTICGCTELATKCDYQPPSSQGFQKSFIC